MSQQEIVPEFDYAVNRFALTDQLVTIDGHVLDSPATVERLVGVAALARDSRDPVAPVGWETLFWRAVRATVIAVDAPYEPNNRNPGVRVRAKTWQPRYCRCPDCGNDHPEGDSSGVESRYDEGWVDFTVPRSALLCRWDEYTAGFALIQGEDWDEFPY